MFQLLFFFFSFWHFCWIKQSSKGEEKKPSSRISVSMRALKLNCQLCLISGSVCLSSLLNSTEMLSNVRLCLRPSLRRDCEVCISGAHSDLETQSHPLIHTKGRGCMNAQMEAGAPSSCRVFSVHFKCSETK